MLAPSVRRVRRLYGPCVFNISQKAKMKEKLRQDQVSSGLSEGEELVPEEPRQLLVPSSTDKATRRS